LPDKGKGSGSGGAAGALRSNQTGHDQTLASPILRRPAGDGVQHAAGIDIDHFRQRLLQEALSAALAVTWTRRAREFEAARSRPGDFLGEATAEAITAMDARLTGLADACRARATLAPLQDNDLDAALAAVLDEVGS